MPVEFASLGAAAILGGEPSLDCFSESYAEARSKFLAAAAEVKAEIHNFKVTEDVSGEYFMDAAILPGSDPGLVVVSSGTHGVEGFAGSAIQISALRNLVGLAASARRAVAPTLCFIHAVNPWGMAHFRRWNENNVDLNRNAMLPHHFERLVKEDMLQINYEEFKHVFCPEHAPSPCFYYIGARCNAFSLYRRYGVSEMHAKARLVLQSGTYRTPKGVFYGGSELQPSHLVLRDFIKGRFQDVPAGHVAWVDLHTGLGEECGVDCLLADEADRAELEPIAPKVAGISDGFVGLFDKSTDEMIDDRCRKHAKESLVKDGPKQSEGMDFVVGALARAEWMGPWFKPDSGRVLCFQHELGTIRGYFVGLALTVENMCYHFDCTNHDYWRTCTRDAFYVRTVDWKRRALRRGLEVLEKTIGLVNVRVTR